jgi:hypothetical protein
MGQTKAQRLIKLFKASGLEETEEFEMDNLDTAKLVLVDIEENEDEVMVENEHGTQFAVDELSNEELNLFLSLFPSKPKKKREKVLRPKEPTKKQRALIQGFIEMVEKDLNDGDYEALDELLCCLLTKKENEKAIFNYLSDDIVERMHENKLNFRY